MEPLVSIEPQLVSQRVVNIFYLMDVDALLQMKGITSAIRVSRLWLWRLFIFCSFLISMLVDLWFATSICVLVLGLLLNLGWVRTVLELFAAHHASAPLTGSIFSLKL